MSPTNTGTNNDYTPASLSKLPRQLEQLDNGKLQSISLEESNPKPNYDRLPRPAGQSGSDTKAATSTNKIISGQERSGFLAETNETVHRWLVEDKDHPKKVLAAYGKAYEALSKPSQPPNAKVNQLANVNQSRGHTSREEDLAFAGSWVGTDDCWYYCVDDDESDEFN